MTYRRHRRQAPRDLRSALTATMPEDDVLVRLIGDGRQPGALQLAGYLVHHIRRADLAQQMGDPGFPDVVAVGVAGTAVGHAIALELKADRGRYETGQQSWLEGFRLAGVDARTVRPEDLRALEDELLGDRLVRAGR